MGHPRSLAGIFQCEVNLRWQPERGVGFLKTVEFIHKILDIQFKLLVLNPLPSHG